MDGRGERRGERAVKSGRATATGRAGTHLGLQCERDGGVVDVRGLRVSTCRLGIVTLHKYERRAARELARAQKDAAMRCVDMLFRQALQFRQLGLEQPGPAD